MPARPPRMARACSRAGLVSFLVILAARGTSQALDPFAAVAWHDSFEGAVAEARDTQRPIWVQFHGPWCGYCRLMEAEVFVWPPLARLARTRLVAVSVRADAREDLLQRYGIQALPATLVLTPDGAVLARREGYAAPADLLGFLDDAVARAGTGLALRGYCPVRLVTDGVLVAGDPAFAVRHDGLTYRFADAAARAAFFREPERFIPSGRGRCAVSRVDGARGRAGDPRWGVSYRGRLYLCADEAARRAFARDPGRYADADVAADGCCPHCRALADRRVPGRDRYALTYAGRRYLFPDEAHRAAFRADPERYLR